MDNSLLIPAFTVHDRTAFFLQLKAIDPDWIVPSIWRFEFLNVITSMTKFGGLASDVAEQALAAADLLVTPLEFTVDQKAAFRSAMSLNISGYDAQYVALAQSKSILCITDDRKLVARAPNSAILLDAFLNSSRKP